MIRNCFPRAFAKCCNFDRKKRLFGNAAAAAAAAAAAIDPTIVEDDDDGDDGDDSSYCSSSTEGDAEWANFKPLHDDAASLSSISESDNDTYDEDDDDEEEEEEEESIQEDLEDDRFYDIEVYTITMGTTDKCIIAYATSNTTLDTILMSELDDSIPPCRSLLICDKDKRQKPHSRVFVVPRS